MGTTTTRQERIQWIKDELAEANPGLPLDRVKQRLAGHYLLSIYTVNGDIQALLGTPGIYVKNGFLCIRASHKPKEADA